MDKTKTILTLRQKKLLDEFFANKDIKNNFYLTGGTALSEFYLHHRLSEDLDLFTYYEIDPISIQVFLKSISQKYKIEKIDFQQSFNRNLFFLHFDREIIKTEFTYFPFMAIEKPQQIGNLKIDSLVDIAVNKTFTIYQKPRSRDFIDLYLIIKNKDMNFLDLTKKARIKFDTTIDPIQLSSQILKVYDLQDYPKMIIGFDEERMKNFWKREVMNLKKQAIK